MHLRPTSKLGYLSFKVADMGTLFLMERGRERERARQRQTDRQRDRQRQRSHAKIYINLLND